ncbi:MAG: Smr/MutS family protein [Oscillospiraceae bacterium]|nr:Smr/MutS family protein [Oscillospiraceae bacterium]
MSQPGILEIDVHRMTKRQAKVFIEGKIRSAGPAVYRIRVIHGYNSGTELRDLVRREIAKNSKVKRVELGLNPGATDLILRELY